ncbi:MAG TPA: T9SS type A sorting domain-containing protein [Catalimonadaceae bacterium]|nr:T9SS type A sorting domain-containing protein [Catalimonadaceae bacterium]
MTVAVTSTSVQLGTVASITNATQFELSSSTTIASGVNLTFTSVTWANAGNVTTVGNATTAASGGSATGRSYNYRDSTAGGDRAIGMQGGPAYATPQSIMVNYRNSSAITMTALKLSYKMERYRRSVSSASVDFYWSTNGSTWTLVPAGSITSAELPVHTNSQFTFNFAPGAPQLAINKTVNITGLSIPTNGDIFIRWNINLTSANSQGIAIDEVVANPSLPCVEPTNSPTALTFPSIGTGSISGSFAAAAAGVTPPNSYLVVRYPAGSAVTNPVDSVAYISGNTLGLGTVVQSSAGTSFTASGLATTTSYDFYIYSLTNTSCSGPKYKLSPLSGSATTLGCGSFGATITIDAVATPSFGTVYNKIGDALNDLSGCPVTQPTVIELQSNYVSTGEPQLVLGAISGMSATNTVTIRPAAGASNLVISGAFVGIPVIDINAGTWWRVDGRAGGVGATQDLTIMNTDNTAVGASAVRLINGAQNNVITYCKVRSSNIGVAGGSINFNSGTITNGNSNNTVSFCDVYSSPSGTPNVGIGSVGLNTANDNNTLLSNNIYDFFNAAGNTYGLYISDLNTNWTVSGNSFYQTSPRILTGGAADRIFSPIGISPTTASTVTGLNFTGNFIGGTAPNCGSGPMTISDNGTATLVLRAIFAQVGTGTATSFQGNTIRNIAMTSSSTSTNQSLISAVTGSFNIGNSTPNVLGNSTGTGSVTFTQTTASTAPRFSGILAGTGTPGTMVISDNNIGSITVSNSSTGRVEMAGIYAQGPATSYTISGNNIGSSSTANSMQNNTTSDSYGIYSTSTATNSNSITNNTVANLTSNGTLYGVRSDGGTNTISTNTIQDCNSATNDVWGINTGSATINNTISGNTIFNLTTGARALGIRTDGGVNTISNNTIRNNSSSSATSLTSAIGIWMASTTAGQTATGNTIHSLQNTTPTAATATAQGIYYTGPTSGTNVIERNLIHSLSLSTSSTSGAIYGIRVLTGVFPVNIQNNMVRLGIDAAGADITTGYAIYGIGNASTGTTNHYFNTLYIGGSGVTGTTSNTIAMLASGALNTRAFQNNILVNTRDGGATGGNHYSFQIGGTGVNPAGLTMNYNLYQTTGSNGFIGSYNAANLTDLTAVQTSVGQNANSYVCDPQLINPNGNAATVNLHILAPPVKTLVEANGLVIGGITQDFDGQTRSALTPTDIGADAGNFTFQAGGCNTLLTWNGSLSSVWGTPANWTPALAPSATTPVVIPGTATQPNITSSVNVLSLSLTGTASPTVGAGGILNILGDVSGASGASINGIGKIVFNGTVQQNVTGTFIASNVDFANVSAQGVVVASGATFRVEPNAASGTGLVTFLNNSRLTNNGKFILGSNSTATAQVGQMPTTTFITGDITMERYLPYTTEGGNWYFIGSTMSGKNFTDFADDFAVTGLSSGFGQQGGDVLSSVEPERSTIFKYDESTHNIRFDTVQKIGWTIPGNENVVPGTGYRVFVKSTSNASHKVDVEGTFTQGDFNFPSISNTVLGACVPASFPCNEVANRGWNLLANPYPCDIDWDAAGAAWSKPGQMSNAWYRWNATGNGYGVYTTGIYAGATPAPANPNLISSSQSFFVKVNTAGSYILSMKELAKSTSTNGTFQRVNASEEKIRIHLSQSQNSNAYGYDAVIRFNESATDGIDAQSDFANLAGSQFQISVPVENTALSIATFAPVTGTKSIPLHIDFQNASGSFTIRFSELDVLSENHQVFLKDHLQGTLTPVFNNTEYAFSSSVNSNDEDRFELVFSNQSVTGTSTLISGGSVLVFPNPSTKGNALTIAITGMESNVALVSITDALGRNVISRNSALLSGGTTTIQIQENLPAGVYMVRTTCGQTTSTQKLVIK